MYFMFIASGDGEYGTTGTVHLVEWKAEATEPGEAFQEALDHYSRERPYMGDWTLITALTIRDGRKIVPLDAAPEKDDPVAAARASRAMKAVAARLRFY